MAETWLYWNDSIPAANSSGTRAVLANPPPSLYPARSHHEPVHLCPGRHPRWGLHDGCGPWLLHPGFQSTGHADDVAHPSSEWTLQQFREALPGDHPYPFVIHDRDSIFSRDLDQSVTAMGVRVLRTPVRAPKANSVCERFGGTLRRECLDFVIPCNERHLKLILKSWVTNFNHGRPHMSLGPGIPAPVCPSPPLSTDRHRIPAGHVNRSKPVLGGLHHEYSLEKVAA